MLSENDLLTAELQGPPSDPLDWKDWLTRFRSMHKANKELTHETEELSNKLEDAEAEVTGLRQENQELYAKIDLFYTEEHA